MLDLSESKGGFQAGLNVEPNVFKIELYCGQWVSAGVYHSWQLADAVVIRIISVNPHNNLQESPILQSIEVCVIFTPCPVSIVKALKLVSA